MSNVFFCQNAGRRQKLQGLTGPNAINGIDFLQVADIPSLLLAPGSPPSGSASQDFRERVLLVHAFRPLPSTLGPSNVTLSGGATVFPSIVAAQRATEIIGSSPPAFPGVAALQAAGLLPAVTASPSPTDSILVVITDRPGDFSTYQLTLSALGGSPPAPIFDVQLGSVSFSFKAACPTGLDCQAVPCAPAPAPEAPELDYLTKDYLGFRQLMLDRLAIVSPDLVTDNAADLPVVLVELLAHAADKASYFQDAVSNEAYLGTALRRISARRHARLLDYTIGEGNNARVFLQFNVPASFGNTAPTRIVGPAPAPIASPSGPPSLPIPGTAFTTASGEIFETMHDLNAFPALNSLPFYTWGDTQCCLPTGATSATLVAPTVGATTTVAALPAVGSILIFVEALGPSSGLAVDADPRHRQAVRLTSVTLDSDPLYNNQPVIDITWSPDDALRFPLCVSTAATTSPVSVALGNVALADHGLTVSEPLSPVPAVQPFLPVLLQGPLTWQGQAVNAGGQTLAFDPQASAASAVASPGAAIAPAIALSNNPTGPWVVQTDLLESDALSQDFVVETDDDGTTELRFGDGTLGRAPSGTFTAGYRVGNGIAGNVGAGSITQFFPSVPQALAGVRVTNPLPAVNGAPPETLAHVRLNAPQAFRVQKRAVTAADYAVAAQLHPDVQRAHAVRRFTGSWSTFFIAVERFGGRPVDAAFQAALGAILEPFRMAGQDFVVQPAQSVPLEIVLSVCVARGFLSADVAAALATALGNQVLLNGQLGFFHPNNFELGQPLYLSQLLAAATAVAGVASIDTSGDMPVTSASASTPQFVFRRTDQTTALFGDPSFGVIRVAPSEVIRVDNDVDRPQNGKITFVLQGGA